MNSGCGYPTLSAKCAERMGHPAFVLAGGQSYRMGRDKALAELAGRPLIAHTLGILREAGCEPRIAGAQSRLSEFASVIPDGQPGLGPLSGICAALRSLSEGVSAVFLSVDMPLLPPSLIAYLAWDAEITGSPVTLASVNGFPQTFPAVLSRAILPQLESALKQGRGGCFAAFESAAAALGQPIRIVATESLAQAVRPVHPAGLPPTRWFANVNTTAELGLAEAWLRRESHGRVA